MDFQRFVESAVQHILDLDTTPTLPSVDGFGQNYSLVLENYPVEVKVAEIVGRTHYWVEVQLPPIPQYRNRAKHLIEEGNRLYISIFDGYWEPDQKHSTSIQAYIKCRQKAYRSRYWCDTSEKIVQYTYGFNREYEALLGKTLVLWPNRKR